MTKHTAHLIAKGADEYLYNAESTSQLKAVRTAKKMWEEEGRGVYIPLQPAEGESDATLEIETAPDKRLADQKAEEAAKAETKILGIFQIDRLSPPDATDPIHKFEISTSDGEVLEGEGEADDGLLEMVEWLLGKINRSGDG